MGIYKIQLVTLLYQEHEGDVLALFNANRDFFESFENTSPSAEMVRDAFFSLPKGIPAENKVVIGCYAEENLIAFVELIKDRHRKGEWLLSLLLLDKVLRKTVKGGRVLRAIFEYIKKSGATAVVGGVIEGNAIARDFWISIGAESTDVVYNQNLNGKSVPTRVMYKQL